MTTKDHCLFFKDKQQDFVVNDNLNAQFKNLNLNQNNQCLSDANHPKNAESLKLLNYDCSLITSSSDYTQNKDSKTEQNSTPFGKTKLSTSFANLNAQNNYDKKEEESKPKAKTLNANSSTLSLHITAYENSVEGAATSGEKDNMKEIKQSRTSIKSWKAAKIDNTNNQVFELPRQQKNENNDPEVMQFKASQNLFNSSSSVTPQPSPKDKTPKLERTFDNVAATPPSPTTVRRQKCIKNELRKGYEMDLLDDLKQCNLKREKHLLGPSLRASLNEQLSEALQYPRVDGVVKVYDKTPKLQKTFANAAATPPSATGVRRQKCIKHELRKGYEMDLLDDLKQCNLKRDQHGLGPIPTTQQPPKPSETEKDHALQLPAVSGSVAVGNRYTPLHHNNPFQHQQQYQYPAMPYQMHQRVQPQIQPPPTMFAPESNHAFQLPAVSGSSAVGNRYTPLLLNNPFQHQQQYQYPAMPYQMHQRIQSQTQQQPSIQNNQQQQHFIQDYPTPQQFYQRPTPNFPPSSRQHRPTQ